MHLDFVGEVNGDSSSALKADGDESQRRVDEPNISRLKFLHETYILYGLNYAVGQFIY